MTLSSLLNDGPILNIGSLRSKQHPAAVEPVQNFAWSDFPAVGDSSIMQQPQPACYLEIEPDSSSAHSLSSSYSSACSMDDVYQKKQRKRSHHKKTVSFNRFLEIREHALTVGDHPLCADALPLSLDWEHSEEHSVELDRYEDSRRAFRRRGNHMKLSYYERKNLLRNIAGMSESDLRDVQKMNASLPSSRDLLGW